MVKGEKYKEIFAFFFANLYSTYKTKGYHSEMLFNENHLIIYKNLHATKSRIFIIRDDIS